MLLTQIYQMIKCIRFDQLDEKLLHGHKKILFKSYLFLQCVWGTNPRWFSFLCRHFELVWPQMKELISQFQPDVFWIDSEWDSNENIWKRKVSFNLAVQ